MDNKELQKKVWANLKDSRDKAEMFEDAVVVTFALISDKPEDLYVAVVDGKLSVEPYHYDQFGCEIEASADTVNKLFAGSISFDKALNDGLAVVRFGDVAKFKALECLVPSKGAKKTAAKTTAKKTAAKKETAKTATKSAAKSTTAKSAAKSTTAKPEAKSETAAAKPAAAKSTAATAKTEAKPENAAAAKPVTAAKSTKTSGKTAKK